jgi:superfamily I DNA/RNA helicase
MWEIRERYRILRAEAGYAYDVDEIAVDVERTLNGDAQPRLYRHVIIDEGQDLSPAMLRALSKAVPADGSLTFFGDVAQQIYGRQMTWRSAGLSPPKIWQFEENYRNTKSIARLAIAVSQMPYYAVEADLVVPKQPAADGPRPTLVSCKDVAAEFAFVQSIARNASKTGSVAILTRTNAQARAFQKSLLDARQLHDTLSVWNDGPGISIGTLHNGKGLEFDTVILPHLSDEMFPHPRAIEHDGAEEAAAVEGRLLYVGVTRARSALLLTYCGQRTTL